MVHKHNRGRGKSGSIKPNKKTVSWINNYKKEEIEKIIIELYKKGVPPSQIGLILRDQYGIPFAKYILGKKLTKFLEEKGFKQQIPEDLLNLMKRAVRVHEHLQKHKKDKVAKRALMLIESKIMRLVSYYKEKGKLPKDWRYSIETAKLLVR